MKFKKNLLVLFAIIFFLMIGLYFLVFYRPTINLSETKFNSSIGSFQKIMRISEGTEKLKNNDILDKTVQKDSNIVSIVKEIARKDLDEIEKISQISKDKMSRDGILFIFDFFLTQEPLKYRNEIAYIKGKYLYEKEKTDDAVGVAIKSSNVGFLTGEVVFNIKNPAKLKNDLKALNFSSQDLIERMNYIIIKPKSVEMFKLLLTDEKIRDYNPKVDIVFDINQTR